MISANFCSPAMTICESAMAFGVDTLGCYSLMGVSSGGCRRRILLVRSPICKKGLSLVKVARHAATGSKTPLYTLFSSRSRYSETKKVRQPCAYSSGPSAGVYGIQDQELINSATSRYIYSSAAYLHVDTRHYVNQNSYPVTSCQFLNLASEKKGLSGAIIIRFRSCRTRDLKSLAL